MLFNLFLLNFVIKSSNYCCVLVYFLQTLALLMARRYRHHHLIQVWILMMRMRACQILPRIIKRPVKIRDLLLLVRRCAVDVLVMLDTGWSWVTNSLH